MSTCGMLFQWTSTNFSFFGLVYHHTFVTKYLVLAVILLTLNNDYGHHRDLVDRYGISVSQMTTDMFQLS